MDSGEATELLGDLASQQWGLLTSAQAAELDVASPDLLRLEKAGVLERIRHGVYAIAGTAFSSEIELKAQWLAIRPEMMAADRIGDESFAVEAVVSHTTAAELWGIGDLWSDGFHFTVPKRRRSRQPEVHFHRADLASNEWQIHPTVGLPLTSISRTIADLVDDGHEAEHLMNLVSDAGSKQLVDLNELFGVLRGKEAAFGLEPGDSDGFYDLLSREMPLSNSERRVAEIMEMALKPVRESYAEMAKAILNEPQFSAEVKAALKSAGVKLNETWGTDPSFQKAVFPDLAQLWGRMSLGEQWSKGQTETQPDR